MVKRLVLASLAVTLSGCATSRQTFGPDGREAYSLNCSGLALSWGACYEKAGSICEDSGYDVVSVNGDSGAVIVANPQGAFGSSVITRSMVVSCRVPGSAKQVSPKPEPKRYQSGILPGSPDCRTRVVSAGGKPIPEEEQCLPMPP